MASTFEALLLAQVGYLMSNAVQPISKQTLAAPAATVTFPSIPQTFTSLLLIITAQSNGTNTNGYNQVSVAWNGIATGYNILATPSTMASGTVTATSANTLAAGQIGDAWNAHFASPGTGRIVAYFPNYTETSFRKIATSESFASDGGSVGRLGLYGTSNGSTAAISSLAITNSDASSFVAGSVFELIGVS